MARFSSGFSDTCMNQKYVWNDVQNNHKLSKNEDAFQNKDIFFWIGETKRPTQSIPLLSNICGLLLWMWFQLSYLPKMSLNPSMLLAMVIWLYQAALKLYATYR